MPSLRALVFLALWGGISIWSASLRGQSAPAIDLDQWKWRYSLPQGNPLTGGVTWTGTQFVAVGAAGTIITSADGVTWANRSFPTEASLYGVASTDGRVVAVGAGGLILSSPDAITWTKRDSGTQGDLYGITWTGRSFVAVGSAGTVLTSPDGTVWTKQTSGSTDALRGVVWNGAQFVVVGGSIQLATILTSADGITWTKRTASTGVQLNAVAWNGTQFVAVGAGGATMTSRDGVAWRSAFSGVGSELRGVSWNGTQFLAVGFNIVLSSQDGVTWTKRDPGLNRAPLPYNSPVGTIYGSAWNGRRFVVVGDGGVIITSTDGVEWIWQSTRLELDFTSVSSSGSRTVATGTNATFISTDGVSWASTIPVRTYPTVGRPGVVWGGNQFLRLSRGISTSRDGLSWTSPTSDTGSELHAGVWSGTQFVVVGEGGTTLTSPDGANWTQRMSGAGTRLVGVAWSGTKFVAVGESAVVSSPDGVTWARASTLVSVPQGVTWGDTQFVMVGYSGTIATSPDGATWTRRTSGTTRDLRGVAWSVDGGWTAQ